MKLKIEDATVRRNIEIFKFILRRALQNARGDKSVVYKGYIHCKQGEIRFVDTAILESLDWQPILFRFVPSSEGSYDVFCEAEGLEKENALLARLEPQAFSVLKQTLKTMQAIALFLPKHKDFFTTLKAFTQMDFDASLETIISGDLIHEAWHQLDRFDVELFLQNFPEGSFVFRKDFYAEILEKALSESHSKEIKCITLSFLDRKNKVCDLTLVHKEGGWQFYDDDPCLLGAIYPSASLLLEQKKEVLKTPILQGSLLGSFLSF